MHTSQGTVRDLLQELNLVIVIVALCSIAPTERQVSVKSITAGYRSHSFWPTAVRAVPPTVDVIPDVVVTTALPLYSTVEQLIITLSNFRIIYRRHFWIAFLSLPDTCR